MHVTPSTASRWLSGPRGRSALASLPIALAGLVGEEGAAWVLSLIPAEAQGGGGSFGVSVSFGGTTSRQVV